jgi:ABC-type glycerol-3-phosphate transport system substrate-binding protein
VKRRYVAGSLAVLGAAALAAVAVSASTAGVKKAQGASAGSGSITLDGVWSGAEAKSFAAVIKAFNQKFPNVKVNYKPVGDNLPTVVSTAVAGGRPPDMADIAQPGLIQQFVTKGALKPITYARGVMARNFAPSWLKLGTFDGKLYGLVFKASNKSTVWYNAHAFKNAGVKPPKTWPQFIKAAATIKASGVTPFSIGGADGWTLTDLFENIYLRTYGTAKYNALSAHKIKWTDSSVKRALTTMGQILGDSSNLAGGTSGALQYGFNDSVTNAFSSPPKAATVFEGDFVAGVILSSTKAKPKTGFDAAPFPAIKPGPNAGAVEIGGDLLVTFRDTPAIRAFVKFLATAPAAEAWAKLGGFGTGNHNVPASIYPDAITRATEAPLGTAKAVVFDMSDEQPASFGSTTGQGEWGIFQTFLRNPKNVSGVQKQLEKAAAAAYKKGK